MSAEDVCAMVGCGRPLSAHGLGSGCSIFVPVTVESRGVQKRKAIQRGEEMPTFTNEDIATLESIGRANGRGEPLTEKRRTKAIRVTVTESLSRPGMLSMRLNVNDPTATPIYRAITETFQAGDVLEIRRASKKSPIAERFAKYVDIDGPTPLHRPELGPCHLWIGSRDNKGYGHVNIDGFRAPLRLAHRVSFFISDGRWPDPCCLHRCDNPSCVRREHLFEGTKADNTADMVGKKRNRNGKMDKAVCANGHEFTSENTVFKPNGHRRCRICKRADWHRWDARRKAKANDKNIGQ